MVPNMQKLTKLFMATVLMLPSVSAVAQKHGVIRGNCTPAAATAEADGARLDAPRRQLSLRTGWDETRTYPVAVLLVEFSDKKFSTEDPADRYNRMFNEQGYNEGRGPGCVAEYFKEQSAGMFKPRFDIYGPVKMPDKCSLKEEYGSSFFMRTVQKAADSLSVDFTPYDWDNDKRAEHIILVYAGYGGNESGLEGKGYIWPNTSSFSTVTVGDIKVAYYSASPELWSNDRSCGIGTICHEYSHALGLPDLYPTSGNEYSVVDEWDLMDGGNFTNNGWCPPNYSAHEKMLLGWLQPVELSSSITVSNLRPVPDGGQAYIVRTDNADEFFILENRQWNGWDLRTPGHGLVISYVNYSQSAWAANTVNNSPKSHRYELVHADNLDYNDWDNIVGNNNPYVSGHSQILSTSPYPYVTDEVENRELTDTSVPAAVIRSGTGLLGKPITGITEDAEGNITFHFMGGTSTIVTLGQKAQQAVGRTIDLLGRSQGTTRSAIVVGPDGRKTLKK